MVEDVGRIFSKKLISKFLAKTSIYQCSIERQGVECEDEELPTLILKKF